MLHMDPDLVGTSCFQSDFKERGVGLRLVEEQLIMGQRSFSADRIRDTFDRGARKSRNGNVNRSFRLSGEVPADRGQIGAVNLAIPHHIRKDTAAQRIFCDDQKPGGITVQAVDGTENKGFLFLFKIPGKSVCQRVGEIALGWVDGNIRGFVYDHQILIFVKNGQRHAHRNNIFRRSLFCKCDIQPVTGFHAEGGINLCPADHQSVFSQFDTVDQAFGVSWERSSASTDCPSVEQCRSGG